MLSTPQRTRFFAPYTLAFLLALGLNVSAQSLPDLPPPSARVNDPLLDIAPEPERGWKGLARALDVLAPSVDTSLPLSSAEISQRISTLIAQGRHADALQAIEKQLAQRKDRGEPGANVQLLFLKARALSASGDHNGAIRLYQNMTTYYPELPEPWNNLAAEYIAQDKLDMALEALKMALTADPSYALARANMGEVQLMLANDTYRQAAASGVPNAAQRAQQTGQILQQ
ncbi:tetratricopeptide repeat protein [Alcaligenes faecalis]|uniref:tetratricopeptide repeat protein n=1 Tax=Alcaligenes faecalis TaxID=511 RepID=UPI0029320BA2|nr:tetratricopeptide repeat protein [Alcaligenes faecalis]MDV2117832.1 tetratricopeptide repeat protein [Alcaligenes faecalis]